MRETTVSAVAVVVVSRLAALLLGRLRTVAETVRRLGMGQRVRQIRVAVVAVGRHRPVVRAVMAAAES